MQRHSFFCCLASGTLAINQANNRIPQLTNKDGSKQVIYSQPTANQQPSAEFTRHYDKYEQDKLNYQQIPTYENLLALQSSERVIIDNYVRQEVFTPIDSPWNYDINPGRVSHYPNDIHNKIDQNGLPVRLILKDDSQIDHRNISQSLIF